MELVCACLAREQKSALKHCYHCSLGRGVGYHSVWVSDHVVPEKVDSFYPYDPEGRWPTRLTPTGWTRCWCWPGRRRLRPQLNWEPGG
jgi:hypothetical protein